MAPLFPHSAGHAFGLAPVFAGEEDRDDRDNDDALPRRASQLHQRPCFLSAGGPDDWVSIAANRPVTTGDKIWTDKAHVRNTFRRQRYSYRR